MSEEIKEWVRVLVDSLQEQITELEKKLISLDAFNKLYDNHKERIEKLEKTQKAYIKAWETRTGTIQDVEEELLELKEEFSQLKNSMRIVDISLKVYFKEINELKEQFQLSLEVYDMKGNHKEIKELKASSASHTEKQIKIDKIHSKQIADLNDKLNTECRLNWKDNQRIKNIEEVLRDFLWSLDDYFEHKNAKKYRKILRKLHKKLGGDKSVEDVRIDDEGTPLQTESQPPRCDVPGCNKDSTYTHKNGWNFCNEHRFEMRSYKPEKPPSIIKKLCNEECHKGHDWIYNDCYGCENNPSEQGCKHEWISRGISDSVICRICKVIKEIENTSELESIDRQTVDYPCEKSKDGSHHLGQVMGVIYCMDCHKSDLEIKEVAEAEYIPMKSDALEALLHSLPDYFKIDWWYEQIRIFVPTHKLVEKEDLIDVLNEDMTRREFREKYLEEDKE